MKKLFLPLLVLFLVLSCESMPSGKNAEYEEKFLSCLDKMSSYLQAPQKSSDELVEYLGYYKEAEVLVKNRQIKLEFTDDALLIKGVNFVAGKDLKSSKLVISKYFVDTFTTKYALHMSVIIREIATVHFAKNGSAFWDKDDYYEQCLYIADPYHILVMFIEELFTSKPILTRYEKSIVNSFNENYLESVLLTYEMLNFPALEYSYVLFRDVTEGDEELLDKFNEQVSNVIEGFYTIEEDAGKYYYHTALNTFVEYYKFYEKKLTKAQRAKVAASIEHATQMVEKYKSNTLDYHTSTIEYYDEVLIDDMFK